MATNFKKLEQEVVNDWVLLNLQEFNRSNEQIIGHERLDYCQARVLETENFILLQSYNTIVAFLDKRNFEMFDFLRYVYGYTATSAKHIAKFRNNYCRNARVSTYR